MGVWVIKITDEHDVVVIGAGAAGIAATRRLVESGVDVLLLEARNRVGGRAHSVRHGARVRLAAFGRCQSVDGYCESARFRDRSDAPALAG